MWNTLGPSGCGSLVIGIENVPTGGLACDRHRTRREIHTVPDPIRIAVNGGQSVLLVKRGRSLPPNNGVEYRMIRVSQKSRLRTNQREESHSDSRRDLTYVVIVPEDDVSCVAIAVVDPELRQCRAERDELRGNRSVWRLESSDVEWLQSGPRQFRASRGSRSTLPSLEPGQSQQHAQPSRAAPEPANSAI